MSLNVNGLGDTDKRRDMFRYLKNADSPIVLIQETHCTLDQQHLWRAEWDGECYFSNGTSASRGVATMFKKNSRIKIRDVMTDSVGRWLITDLDIEEEIITLVNVYGPNEDRAEFYLELFEILENRECQEIILAGDLNLTLDPRKDYGGLGENINHRRKREVVQNYMQTKGLCDVWRCLHEQDYVFTWKRDGPPTQTSRLDYFLISDSLRSRVVKTHIAPRYRTDHNRIELIMNFEKSKRGKGFWKVNNSYLKDKEFVEEINQAIENFGETFNHIVDPVIKWEMLKVELKAASNEYLLRKARSKSKLIQLLEHKLEKLDARLVEAVKTNNLQNKFKTLKDLKQTEEFLQEEHECKTASACF